MSGQRKLVVPVLVLLAMLALGASVNARRLALRPADLHGAYYRLTASDADRDHATYLSPAVRSAGPAFGAEVSAADQAAIMAAIASARPEARKLIGLVDGTVTVDVGTPGNGAAGVTATRGDGHYEMTLDLAGVGGALGARGIARLVLHEFGHVVDGALLQDELTTRLDAGVPRSYGCEDGVTGACAKREERFAESFAKWAMNDIGVNLDIGYKILPPTPNLELWGAPLAQLAAEA